MRAFRTASGIDALGVDVGAFGKLLAAAQHIAQCRDCLNLGRVIRDQPIKQRLRLVAALKRVEPERTLDLCTAIKRGIGRQPLVHFHRQLVLLHPFIEVGERKQRHRVARCKVERKLQIDQPEIFTAPAPEHGSKTVEHFGSARLVFTSASQGGAARPRRFPGRARASHRGSNRSTP